MYQRKTKDVYILMGHYGYRWEELATYETKKKALQDYKAYKENEPQYHHKIIKKRGSIKRSFFYA